MNHPCEGYDRDVMPRSRDRRLAEFNLVVPFRNRSLDRKNLAVFQKHHRVVATQGSLQQSLGVCRIRRDDDSQTGDLRVHRVVIARMVCRGRMADTNTTSQQDRHLQATAAHVLHFGNLVDDFTDRIEYEIGEHEIDNGSRSRHPRSASQSDESSFADRCVTESFGAVKIEQACCGFEVTAANTDPFPHHEDPGIRFHLFCECLVRRLSHRDRTSRRGRRRDRRR